MIMFKRNNLTKLATAIVLSLTGAIGSMSALAMATDNEALAQEVRMIKVEVDAEQNMPVKLYVNDDGKTTKLNVAHDVLSDKSKLRELLNDVPEDLREKLIASLNDIGDEGTKIHFNHDIEHDGEERVIIINDDDTVINKHIIKEFSDEDNIRVIEFAHSEGSHAKHLVQALERGKFSVDELNAIQQALDKKR